MIEKQPTGDASIDNSDKLNFEKMTEADIDSVLKIQEEQSISKIIEDKEEDREGIERNGFLVHLLSKEEISEILNIKDGVETIVCRENGEVVGYLIGYNLNLWRELNPDWESNIDFAEGFDESELTDDSIYLRHVNTSPNATAGIGRKISSRFVEESQQKGFSRVYGEILKEPYTNRPSMVVHKRLGFNEIAEIKETDENLGGLKWALMQKKF
jgi:predicted GNAT superfamily acetyltransferase